MKVYVVGGAIRDKLLGRDISDRDHVVVGATPQEMVDKGFRQVGKGFPVFLHPDTNEEYALARTEKKIAPGHKGFSCSFGPQISLEEDLLRRDLTINAMAMDDQGKIIDPYNGQEDLKNRRLRHVSPHFSEDPLRVLRVARFSAQLEDFEIHGETLELMRQIAASGELLSLGAERVTTEFKKALLSPAPWHFINALFQCHAIEVLFPEIAQLKDIPQSSEYHPEGDALVHTKLALEGACSLSNSFDVRLATLFHDLGKATTPAEILPKHTGHEDRGEKIIEELVQRLKLPTSTAKLARLVAKYHFKTHQILELPAQQTLDILNATGALHHDKFFSNYLICCQADNLGKLSNSYPQAEYLRECQKALREQDNAKICHQLQGRELGHKIEELQLTAINKIKKRYQK